MLLATRPTTGLLSVIVIFSSPIVATPRQLPSSIVVKGRDVILNCPDPVVWLGITSKQLTVTALPTFVYHPPCVVYPPPWSFMPGVQVPSS